MLLQRFPRLQDWWRYYWAVPRGGGSAAKANRGQPYNGLQLAKMRHKMISRTFPNKFQQIWHRFHFQWLYLFKDLSNWCSHIRMGSRFHKFSESNFGQFWQFFAVWPTEVPNFDIVSVSGDCIFIWKICQIVAGIYVRMSSQFHKFS